MICDDLQLTSSHLVHSLRPFCYWSYRSGARRESSVGEVRAAEVPQVRDHEEGVSDIRRGLEEAGILPPPQY